MRKGRIREEKEGSEINEGDEINRGNENKKIGEGKWGRKLKENGGNE